jgi:7-carboxy-7-deazaguanine synthase
MKPEDIMEQVLAKSENSGPAAIPPAKSKALGNVVLTGGEPFYLWHGDHQKLISRLKKQGGNIFFETSGKVAIPLVKGATIVASPKFYEGKGWIFLPQNLKHVTYYKFVLHNQGDLNRVNGFIMGNKIPREKVFLMPGGKSKASQARNGKWVFQVAVKLGYGFSPRLHIMFFGNQRGV